MERVFLFNDEAKGDVVMPAMPTRTPASRSAPASLSSDGGASRHFVWARSLTRIRTEPPGDDHWPLWLTACYQLTPHLQRFGPDSALLDLGNCTDTEAMAAVQALITRLQSDRSLQSRPVTLQASIGPSGILAQLALLRLLHTPAPAHGSLTILTPEQTADLLRELPIMALTRLQFADRSLITPAALAQAVDKLDGYGVRSLAHLARLARLDETSLRRQFGTRIGMLLAAVAHGEDPLPFQPTPAPLRLHFRLRLLEPLAADRLVAGLAPFTLEVASSLARRGLCAHTVELRLRWETGSSESGASSTRTLPQPIADARALNETVQRLLTPLIQHGAHAQPDSAHTRDAHEARDAIDDFHLIVSHLVPRYPAQHAFWPQRARRLATARELAGVLARRYGKPLLFHGALTAPDAIFDQDRSRLAPVDASNADGADVLEDWANGAARPAADVAHASHCTDAPDTSDEIPHGIHWW
jgi:nucleotidyltransferase/DNA polymerase involved in DNA repair